jgi:uncharacterized protein (TIGR03086 family)
MDSKQLFTRALEQATEIIDQVTPHDFTYPTPNTEWDVRTLVAHMLYELSWVPDVLQGKTITDVGDAHDGDLIGRDLQSNWQTAAEKAHHALSKIGPATIVHLSFADVTAEEYLRQVGCDLFIHTWDLGEGIGRPVAFRTEEAQAVYDYLQPNAKAWQEAKLFAEPIVVPDNADLQTKLLALTGRQAE